jgi:hypothetical protein
MSNLALIKAVAAARPRQVRLLLEAGVPMENVDDSGQTALVRAVFIANNRSREKIVRALLRFGSQVSSADIVGRNALAWACLYGRDKEVAHMLQYADLDLDLNARDMNNQTALFHAATSGSAATVKLMVDALNRYGLTVDVPDTSGVTPLMHATQLGNDVCASILIFQGNAKIGLTMNYPEDLISAERWATKIQREKEKNVISQFPPIIPQSTLNRIKYYESKAAQMRALTPFDSDDECTSTYGSEYSYYTDTSIDSLNFECSPRHVPTSMMVITSAESGVEEDLPETQRPIVTPEKRVQPKKKQDFKPNKELDKIYKYYTEELTGSYRAPAKVPEQATALESSDASVITCKSLVRSKSKKDINAGEFIYQPRHLNFIVAFVHKLTTNVGFRHFVRCTT